ncbi:MAG: hypothetical protein EXS55_03795 [Candidatus Magasanikbacteria bacterium]|nr:hypothetical protein [Candidatus Magasanikbacteria bacterium]
MNTPIDDRDKVVAAESEFEKFSRLSTLEALELAEKLGYQIKRSDTSYTIFKAEKEGGGWFVKKEVPGLKMGRDGSPYR